ncbi:Uncharacterised protein [Dermatophilus congolensis]|uniref:DUF2637 domain-containing protein n=1 Tax=Dermatophilus congolensis TaxID=1863 RepID=A0AA46H110_9MICO|nr:hypothetical protein [Dermatophilus congolensis]STD12348.1 Uncharacterised protein [Dermatophilus congolensis]
MTNAKPPQAATSTATRRSRTVLTVTVLTIAIPLVLSAHGIALVGIQALNFPVEIAIAMAIFCELAFVVSALSAREAIITGRCARNDLIATWAIALVTGIFSALHEILTTAAPKTISITVFLAITLRFAAPLIAAWLWHNHVLADAEERAAWPWDDRIRHNATLDVAVAARQAAASATNRERVKASARLEAIYLRLCRSQPNLDQAALASAMRQVAAVDSLPALATTKHASFAPNEDAENTPQTAPQLALAGSGWVPQFVVADSDKEISTVAAKVLDLYGDAATGRHVQEAMSHLGHHVADRTARRWLSRARQDASQQAAECATSSSVS